MKCPDCVNEGLKSKVVSIPIVCMTAEVKYDHSWYDEEGEYHNHNHYKSHYKCSNAHEFIITDHCDNCKDCCN